MRRLVSSRSWTTCGKENASGRPTRTWYVPGTRSSAAGVCPSASPSTYTVAPAGCDWTESRELAGARQLRAQLVEACAKGRRERVGAHDVTGIDPQDGAKRVVRGVATSQGAQRHAPDELGIAERLRSVGTRRKPLELDQGLVQQRERVGDAVVVEEVLGGGDLPAHLVQGVGGRRSDACLELLLGEERRSDPLRRAAPRIAARTAADPGPGNHRARPAPSGASPPHPRKRAAQRASRRESRPRPPPVCVDTCQTWHVLARRRGADPGRAMV